MRTCQLQLQFVDVGGGEEEVIFSGFNKHSCIRLSASKLIKHSKNMFYRHDKFVAKDKLTFLYCRPGNGCLCVCCYSLEFS